MSNQALRRSKIIGLLPAVLLVLCLLAGKDVYAQAPSPTGPGNPSTASWQDLESFFDPLIGQQLAEQHVAGAAVSVVKDGQILFAAGYGEADVAEHLPVTAGGTLFRISSVSKLFTWTAVMQLVEQGRLDLDADVNSYLDFEIPATFPEPVTLRHLLSHSAGFEDRLFGIFVDSPEKLIPASQWLPANLPARVRPAGVASAYSNYGTALAGYIVERVSGMTYDDYIEANILQPLGMAHTSTRQPLPPELAQNLSGGYTYTNGAYVAYPFEVMQTAPAGSMSATAADMAAFMLAHLQDGRYGEQRILAEATTQQMHSPLFQHDPRLNGYAYGFQRIERNGQIVLSHSGDSALFHSQLILIPTSDVGLFVAFNSANSSRLRAEVVESFLDHFFPTTLEPVVASAGFAQRAGRFTGAYQSIRHSYTTPDKVVAIMQTAPIWTLRAEGEMLVMDHPWKQGPLQFVEVEPLLFRQVDGPERLAFRENSAGQVEMAFLENYPAFALEKLAWYELPAFHLGLLSAVLLLFLSLPIVYLVSFLRRMRSERENPQPRLANIARWTVAAVTGLTFAYLFALILVAGKLMASLGADSAALDLLQGLSVLPWLIALLTFVGLILLAPVWRRQYWQLPGRIYHTVLVVASAAFVWLLAYWSLL